MTWRAFALVLWALESCLAAAAQPAAAVPLYTDQNMPPAIYAQLLHSQELALNLQYEQAEALLQKARAAEPAHPLGGVFLLATRLSMLQESLRRGSREVPKGFFKDVDALIVQAQAQAEAYPKSAYPKFYLGAALGCRGLAKLYTGHYLDSYFDGKNGVDLVRQAVAIEPKLYDAYMGLGQFEYYCGSLGGMLRFILALKGSEEKGLEMLQTCGEKATYAVWPCRLYRVKLLIRERGQYQASAQDLAVLLARYPDNHDLLKDLTLCLEHGVTEPDLLNRGETVLEKLKGGWNLPSYAKLEAAELQLLLAKAWLARGAWENAVPHLNAVAAGKGPRAAEAKKLLQPKAYP